MTKIGSIIAALLLTTSLFVVNTARAAVTASLDRYEVAMGDTLRLALISTEGEEVSNAELRPLLTDFEILQRSTSSNVRIVNGSRSHTKQLLIDITPRRTGTLQIPPIIIGGARTNPLQVTVSSAPDVQTGGQPVVFEAEVDRESVYVQGQLILTLRLYVAINLEGGTISEPQIDNAFIKELEQKTFQRTINGRPWQVHEVRYAIFPEQSGTLSIPAQQFSGQVREGRRSFLSMGGGRLLRRSTEPLSAEVLPRPDTFTGSNWLPARQLQIEEQWSTSPDQLRVGESTTRTIRILGEGVQGAQLPPVLFAPIEGLKFYPDQPDIKDREVSSGLLGVRQDSAAIVPTSEGTLSIPEIRMPWWDTEAEQVRYAIIPGHTVTVAPADPATITAPAAGSLDALSIADGSLPAQTTGEDTLPWKILSAVSTIGWILTLLFLWSGRGTREKPESSAVENTTEKQAFNNLLSACQKNNAGAARAALIAWSAAISGQSSVASLDQVSNQLSDADLEQELNRLDSSLYSPEHSTWSGQALTACVTRLRGEVRKRKEQRAPALRLYPGAG